MTGQVRAALQARDRGRGSVTARADADRGGRATAGTSPRAWRRRLASAVIGLAAIGPGAVAAHPHVFVEYAVTVLVGARGIEGVRIGYTFDPMFTDVIVQTFDTDKDGTLSRNEIRMIEQKHFSNLREYDYFVTLRSGGRSLPVAVGDFDVRVPRDRATYLFTVPVRGLDAAGGDLEIVIDDPTFYTAFFPREDQPVQVKGAAPYRVQCSVARDPTATLPDAVRCESRRVDR